MNTAQKRKDILHKLAFTPLTPEASAAATQPPPPQEGAAPAGAPPPQAGGPPPQGGGMPPELMQMLQDPQMQQILQQIGIAIDPAQGPVDMQTGQPIPPEQFMQVMQQVMQQPPPGAGAPPAGAGAPPPPADASAGAGAPPPAGAMPPPADPAAGAPPPEAEAPAEEPEPEPTPAQTMGGQPVILSMNDLRAILTEAVGMNKSSNTSEKGGAGKSHSSGGGSKGGAAAGQPDDASRIAQLEQSMKNLTDTIAGVGGSSAGAPPNVGQMMQSVPMGGAQGSMPPKQASQFKSNKIFSLVKELKNVR